MSSHPITTLLLVCATLLTAACGRESADQAVQSGPDATGSLPAELTPERLRSATYPSTMRESGTVTLTDGRHVDDALQITTTLLAEPMGHGLIAGAPAAAVLIAENGGGSGTFVRLVLVGIEADEPRVFASAFLGDRPRVRSLEIGTDDTVTVDLVQVGANDRFCCPATPMRVTWQWRDGALVTRDVTSASIDVTGYANQANAFILPFTAYDRSLPPSGQGEPAHFAWTFDAHTSTDAARGQLPDAGYVAIYPVEAWRAIWTAAGDPFLDTTLTALETLLEERPAAPPPPLPVLPKQHAVNDFAAQVAYLELPDGLRGVRFVGRFAQDAAPLRNYQLRYVFQGLSADGHTLVVASLPIATAALPDDTAVAVVDPDAPQRDITAHLEHWRETFEGLEVTQFTPSLETLDDLVRSVRVSRDAPVPDAP
jgi:hypothetical protein